MEEGVLDVELVNGPPSRERQGQNSADGCWLHHMTECLIEIHTWPLSESTQNPASLVPFQGTVSLELVLEDLFAGDHISTRWPRNQIPGLIPQECSMLFFHGSSPIGVGKGATEGLQDGRQGCCVVQRGNAIPLLCPGRHRMLIHDWGNNNSPFGQRRRGNRINRG